MILFLPLIKFLSLLILFFLFKIESKKLDFKEKAKPRTDSGKHETITSGGGGGDEASASATVNEETEKSDEVFESQKNDNGDK